jgi:glycosyltransferase involved in cell wall biosynthesis
MRVCLLSTYLPQRCGIATYTAALAHALAEDGGQPPVLLSEWGALSGDDHGVISYPTFSRTEDYGPSAVKKALELKTELVHVQHSPDILGMDQRLPNLLAALRQQGIATVVTLHTVHTVASAAAERRFGVGNFHRRLAEAAGALVVHGGPAMAAELVRQGVPDNKIQKIAHGTPVNIAVDRAQARLHLGLAQEAKVLLCFGFIHLQKNLHTVVLAMNRVLRQVPNALLYIAGSLQNRAWYNRSYLQLLRTLIRQQGLAQSVVLREEFVSTEEAAVLYGACDVVLLPYAQGYGSASGIAHSAIGARRIPLCSRSPKFLEIGSAIDPELLVPTHSPKAWADALLSLLTDEPRRAILTERVARYAEETAWPEVARRHRQLYRSLVSIS